MLPSLLLAVLLVAWGPGGALAQPALQPAAAGSELPRALLDERSILLDFRDQITNWGEVKAKRRLKGWTECTGGKQDGCTNVCAWSGITCGGPDANSVAKLDLSCANCPVKLRGTILPQVAYLDYLVNLDLSHNELSGTLPELWGMNNTFLSLVELNLNENQIGGPIPESWGIEPSMNALFNMQLAGNRLTGTVPQAFCVSETSYFELMSMNFANNQLSGPLPPYINGLITMDYVSFADNRFTGALPPDWGLQAFVFVGEDLNATQALAVVRLEGNQLTGTLPREWARNGSFTVLRQLSLGRNRLSGPLPDEWAALPELETLNASAAGLGGALPQWGPGPATLKTLDVSLNNFTGAIPASWSSLPNLNEVLVQLGNPGLCPEAPPGSAFSVCGESPICSPYELNTLACPSSTTASASGGSGSSEGSGGSSFPVAAVAVPCAVVAAAAALGGLLLWRRRRHQRAPPGGTEPQEAKEVFTWLDSTSPPVNSTSASGSHNTNTGSGSAPRPDPGLEALSNDWRLSPDELEFVARPDGTPWQLGAGGFGVVLKARRGGVQPVAVKVLRSSAGVAGRLQDATLSREISILRACRDANILQFVGAFVREDEATREQQLCLVTEFMEGGSLQANLRHGRISWHRHGRRVALDLARALAYLHSKRLVHLDVKSSNVLLSRDGTAKLGDLGMAKLLVENYVTGTVGTMAWSAPEMLMGQRCSEKADIYSYGVVLWEICTGELPARGMMRDPRCPEECPREVDDIINRCMEFSTALRPTAVQLVQLLEALPAGPPGGRPAPPRGAQQAQAQQQQQQAQPQPQAQVQRGGSLCSWPSSSQAGGQSREPRPTWAPAPAAADAGMQAAEEGEQSGVGTDSGGDMRSPFHGMPPPAPTPPSPPEAAVQV